jgi:vesicle coat complex subunit
MLTTSTILKDLNARGPIEKCFALSIVDSLFTPDLLPSVLPRMYQLLTCEEDIVRQRTVITIAHLMRRFPQQFEINEMTAHLARAIGDRSPSVLSAALSWLGMLLEQSPSPFRATSLAGSLVNVLNQCLQFKVRTA